jgi:hypothetical protein
MSLGLCGSDILGEMARRLLAFALAFVVVAGPFVSAVCEAACAEHGRHAIDSPMLVSHHHHSAEVVAQSSHHHHSDAAADQPARSAGFMPAPRGCVHLDAIVTESREAARAPVDQAAVTMVHIAPLPVHRLPASEMDSRHGPPTPIRSASPLRI